MLNEANEDSPGDEGQFKDTVILENTVFEPLSDKGEDNQFERLPKGETVTLTLSVSADIDILLSRHECKILAGSNNITFIDHEGRSSDLQNGRNVVGRDSVSTIMMDPALRDVSRLHIVIEKFDNLTIQITDLSSHGTFIKAKYLDNQTG